MMGLKLIHVSKNGPWASAIAILIWQWMRLHNIHTLQVLKPRRSRRHFAGDIFKYIFLNGNVWISIKFHWNFFPKGPSNNIPALAQIMAWRRQGTKPLSEPTMVSLLVLICLTRSQWVLNSRHSIEADIPWLSIQLVGLYTQLDDIMPTPMSAVRCPCFFSLCYTGEQDTTLGWICT